MTTVVCCLQLGVMAADTRITHGDGRFKSTKKVQRVGSKFLVGVAGDYARCLNYLEVFRKKVRRSDGKGLPKLPPAEGEGDLELVVMSEHGIWCYFEDGVPMEVEEEYYATGSGGKFAIASLDTQKELGMPSFNLAAALAVACKHDENSSLPAVSISLKKGNDDADGFSAQGAGEAQPAGRRGRQGRAQA